MLRESRSEGSPDIVHHPSLENTKIVSQNGRGYYQKKVIIGYYHLPLDGQKGPKGKQGGEMHQHGRVIYPKETFYLVGYFNSQIWETM